MAFIKITKRTNGNRTSSTKSIVESYREWGKIKHRVLSNISFLDDEQIAMVSSILKGEKLITIDKIIRPQEVRPYGATNLIFQACEQSWLTGILKNTGCDGYENEILTLIINRLLDPRSRNSIAESWFWNSSLSYILDRNDLKQHRLYEALEHLVTKQICIEDKLFQQTDKEPSLVYYDITSTYFEWSKCPIATWWYDRDGNKKCKRIVAIGVITDRQWKPISVEVFEGNTPDTKTMKKKILELKQRFGIKKVLLVVDRGMNVAYNLETLMERKIGKNPKKNDVNEYENLSESILESDLSDIDYITALKKCQIRTLQKKKILTIATENLFTKETPLEFIDHDEQKKYVCTYNETLLSKDQKQRQIAIEKTEKLLLKFQNSLWSKKNSIKKRDDVLKKIWWYLGNSIAKDFFIIDIPDGKISFTFCRNEEAIKEDSMLDGWYVLVSSDDSYTKEDIVRTYRQKDVIEKFFEVSKWDLDLRPVYVRNTERVKWHIFICFLAMYVRHYLKEKLAPFLEKYTWQAIMDELQTLSLCKYDVTKWGERVFTYTTSQPTLLSREIYNTFGLSTDASRYVVSLKK